MQGRQFDGVVLAARYSQQDVSQLEVTVKRLAALERKELIVGPSIALRRNIEETHLAKKFHMNQSIVSLGFDANVFFYDSIGISRRLRSIASSLQLIYFDRLTAFCPEEHCYLRKGEAPLLTDSQHLSVSGIRYLAEAFRADVQVVEFFDTANRSLIQENAHSLIQAK